MSNHQFDFTIDIPDNDRRELLQLASQEISSLGKHLSDGEQKAISANAVLLNAIMDDAVILPPQPIMHKISNKEFLARDFDLPVDIKQILAVNNFYWLQVPVGIYPKENWAYSRIETGILMETVDGMDIPRAIRILPEKEFQQLFSLDTSGEVGLDANFNFSANTADHHFEYKGNKLDMSAKAAADGTFKSKLVFGPLSFKIRRIKIDQNGKNTQAVRWTLNDTKTIQDGFDLIAILQIPKTYKQFRIHAEVRARKSLNDFPSILDMMKFLTEKAKLILKTGCPTRDTKQWDLSMYL